MEQRLFQDVLLPLEEAALRKVIVSMWNDALNSHWLIQDNLSIVGDKVKEKVSQMLPPLLKKRVMPLVMAVGSEILNWKMCHENCFRDVNEDFGSHFLKHFHWTCLGTIDYRKTAENLIRLKMFDVTKRFELACLHCLEEYIPLLWEEVSEDYKRLLKEEFYSSVDMQLKYYWAYLMKGEEHKFKCIFQTRLPGELTFHQYAFKLSAVNGNKAATRFFYQKLSNKERDASLLFTIYSVVNERCRTSKKLSDFPKQNLTAVLCYLLSLMSPEEQMQALKSFPCAILVCFLDWPFNYLFFEIADVIWTFLQEKMFPCLLTYMYKIIRTLPHYNRKLFQEFFMQSPGNFKREFVDRECRFGYFFFEFFTLQDSETIKVIFRNIDPADSVRLVFGEHIFKLLCNSIFTGNWHMVKMCLREAMLSKREKRKLKKRLVKYISKTHKRVDDEEKTRKRKWVCEYLGGQHAIAVGEENSKDEAHIGVKKLCTEEKKKKN